MKSYLDIIVPRGVENRVAMSEYALMSHFQHFQLTYDPRHGDAIHREEIGGEVNTSSSGIEES